MKNTFTLLAIILAVASISAQPCDVTKGLSEIETSYQKGFFDEVLEQAQTLQHCDIKSNEQYIDLLVWEYKVLRNTRKNRTGHAVILKAISFMKEHNIPVSFDHQFLLAESYALRGDLVNYKSNIKRIEDSLLPMASTNTVDIGRYLLIQFYATDVELNPSKGAAIAQKALSVLEKTKDAPVYYLGNSLRGLGNMYRTNGDFDRAHSYYQQELELYQKNYHKDHFDISVCHYNLGNVFYEKLEYQQALDHYLKAHTIWTKVFSPKDGYMRNLNEAIGDMYWELEDKEKALTYFSYSVIDEKNINNDESEQTMAVADSLLQKGNYGNAIDYYKEAYNWREKTYGKDHMLTGACKNFVARAMRSKGDITESLHAYQEAIDILVEEMNGSSIYENPTLDMSIRSYQYLLESMSAKGELLQELFLEKKNKKDLEASLATQEIAIRLLEKMKHGHMSESSKVYWSRRTLSLIENSIEVALQMHEQTQDVNYLEKAFSFSERSKALLLLTALNENENTLFANVPEEILSEEKEIRQGINEFMGRLENEEKRCGQVRPKLLEAYKDKLTKLQKKNDLLLFKIKADFPEFYELKYEMDIVQLGNLQNQLLDANSALISYFAGDVNTYVFFITSNNISVRRIDDSALLFDEVSSYFKALRSQELMQLAPQETYLEFGKKSFLLYEKLLQPELEMAPTLQRLIIVPDGNLSYIPFESLLTKRNSQDVRDYKSLPYLLKKYAISYSPSASIRLRSNNDPNAYTNYMGFAPNYEGQQYTDLRKELSNLQYNTSEVDYARALFNGKSWTGITVTENLLKNNTHNVGILHLAMHGDVEDEHPLLSKLYFNESEEEDGILHTYEIYNMTIPAQLVILSACNTALGKLERGEGILSLERAFQYAGSKSLLSTMWTVDDASSAKLTQYFLDNLKEGKSKDIALQEAKLQFLNTATPETLHPFYWSSFRLTGNTESLVRNSKLKYWLGGGIAAVFLFLIYARMRQVKKAA